MNTNHNALVEQLVALITQGNAHVTFEKSVENIPFNLLGATDEKLPYTLWQLVEHIRITQHDILDFSTNADYKHIKWPDDYWPAENTPADENTWKHCLEQIRTDRDELVNLLTSPGVDIYTPFPYGDGQNLLREALLAADHTSYHTGQIILLRRLLNNWGAQ